jgi:hypothetical protein
MRRLRIDPNRALFESVVQILAPVLDELVFVGGCTTGLFITDPAAAGTPAAIRNPVRVAGHPPKGGPRHC